MRSVFAEIEPWLW